MDVARYDDPAEFWAVAGPLYEADPVRNTLAITVAHDHVIGRPFTTGEPKPLLLTVVDGDDIVGAALCTPPWPIIVSAVPPRAAAVLVEYLNDAGLIPSGASGPRDAADAFARVWRERTGAEVTVGMDMRCYRLATPAPPDVAGEFRLAGESDLPLLAAHWRAFLAEAVAGSPESETAEQARRALRAGDGIGLWVDGTVRASARASRPRFGMSRIGMVYTPPEHRRRGYGAAVAAAVSQWALDRGAADVVLFTDLANPTSNSIYRKIGYVPIYDAVEYWFTA